MNVHISGNLSGRTVVFLAGWPDTPEVFRENLMHALAQSYRLVGITLPGFDHNSPLFRHHSKTGAVALPVPLLGYSFDELVDLFEIAILAAMEHSPLERPMLIAHDWGCVVASEFLLTRPYFFSRVVLLDTGGPVSDTSFLTPGDDNKSRCLFSLGLRWAFIFLFQLIIVTAYILLPEFLGRRALRVCLRVTRRPQYRYACSPTIKPNKNAGKEFVLVSSYVQEKKKKDPPLWSRWKSWRLVDVVNAIIHFGCDNTDSKSGVNTLDAAFHQCRYYYTNGLLMYTQPPHPSATGVCYTCYSCHGNSVECEECRTFDGSNKSKCFRWSDKSSAKTQSDSENIVDVDPAWGWIYLRYWMLRLSRLLPASQRFLIPVAVPVLFLYGSQKPVMLHTPQWEHYIGVKGQYDGSEVIAFPGGHWFFAELGNRRRVAERVAEFLEKDTHESLVD
ncbi:uncharacterized protein TM35_000082040 [Trypanosoma theileri]|uniref:AB hydrolase-1 domain-containing protein n=1 Tax=Trypanosoma theileri TaxID=67003 RepID=A0A1X0P0C8_9TRYP|nr:uncharacterized protein TM35_000082040 [Trypanosoma theileri]ORC90406.1 hypothetical protein TM35_000082040 [Trypanosoma theileri]